MFRYKITLLTLSKDKIPNSSPTGLYDV